MRLDLIPSPFFLGFGINLPFPILVLFGVHNPANAVLGILGVALMLVGIIRMSRRNRGKAQEEILPIDLDIAYRSGVKEAAEVARQAMLEAGDDPHDADSLRNRVRGLAGLEAL